MKKMLSIAAALALTAGCSKDKDETTTPETTQYSMEGQPHAEEQSTAATTPSEAEPTAGEGALTETAEDQGTLGPEEDRTLAGGRGQTPGRTMGETRETSYLDPSAATPEQVKYAVAVLQPTKGSKVKGVVRFMDTGSGLQVRADVFGLSKGKHAYHVHLYGDCSSPDAESAGEHFDFMGSHAAQPGSATTSGTTTPGTTGTTTPGATTPDTPTAGTATGAAGGAAGGTPAHTVTGNLGDLEPMKSGKAVHSAMIQNATLQGRYSIIGRAVVVHEKGNDLMSPDGDAGKRLACGVIGVDPDGDPSLMQAPAGTEPTGEEKTGTGTPTETPAPPPKKY